MPGRLEKQAKQVSRRLAWREVDFFSWKIAVIHVCGFEFRIKVLSTVKMSIKTKPSLAVF